MSANPSSPLELTRRAALAGLAATAAAPALAAAPPAPPRRIAVEEAFTTPEIAAAFRRVVERGGTNLDLALMRLVYGARPAGAPPASGRDALALRYLPDLIDVDRGRLADMDAHGVAMRILSLGSPGVQMLAADEATALARSSNDQLAAAIARHPARFAGLAAFAPQDPPRRRARDGARGHPARPQRLPRQQPHRQPLSR